jgi:2',3'-cyclic-nucleotide 2'-phosphodiesterase (5'-nucleotidase family)
MNAHPPGCTCGQHDEQSGMDRRDFLKLGSVLGAGLGLSPTVSSLIPDEAGRRESLEKSRTVAAGKAQRITILHTSDIHAQLHPHDEFFWEDGQAVYRKRGGLAVLKTMIRKLRSDNPYQTLLIDGGDCFQGGGLATLTEGRALVPMMNQIGYDLMLPGNWEVTYGKKMMLQDLGGYTANKVCANMWHDSQDEYQDELIFPPYWVKYIGGVKIGCIGFNDPLTFRRQPPAYSKGIRFTPPEKNVRKYVKLLRDQEQCALVFLVTHMGLAQQIGLANMPDVEGVDFILGADTHERVRQPIQGAFSRVTEPGAFGSFISKLDIILEKGQIKDTSYELLEVDPARYKADEEMLRLIAEQEAPHKKELTRVVGTAKTPLVRYFVIETPMDNLITDALMWKFKPDIALSNGFRFCPPLTPDPKTGIAEITKDFLYGMLPADTEVQYGEVNGKQLRDWLEIELENAFAQDPAKRFGGWLVRFKGMEINFTIAKPAGSRINQIRVGGKDLDENKTYRITACLREGDPADVLCRISKVRAITGSGVTMHQALEEYLAKFSPVEPKLEGRATATDAPATLLTQLSGYNYQFR